jgi:hypothetical protein
MLKGRSIFLSCVRDAWPLLISRKVVYITLGLCSVIVAMLLAIGGSQRAALSIIFAWNLAGLVGQCFVIPSVVRTQNVSFRMTFGKLLFGFLIYCGAGIPAVIGLYAFIIPGIWVGTKLSLSYMLYMLDLKHPFRSSWQLTNGRFWQTALVLFCGLLLHTLICFCSAFSGIFLTGLSPWTSLLCAPLVLAAYLWSFCFFGLLMLRWTTYLREAI